MTAELINILKLRKLRISYNEKIVSAILETKLWNTLLSVSHAERTRFKEINNMMKWCKLIHWTNHEC